MKRTMCGCHLLLLQPGFPSVIMRMQRSCASLVPESYDAALFGHLDRQKFYAAEILCRSGEFTASCAAGAFSFEDGVKIVSARGNAMADAAAENKGGMIAVTSAAAGHQVIKTEFGGKLIPANVLAEGVVVYAGSASDCDRLLDFCDEFMKRGQVRARASRVAVAGAFHTHMMQVCRRCFLCIDGIYFD